MAKHYRVYCLCFTRYMLKVCNFCERVRKYKWDSLRVNLTACNISVVLTTDTSLLAIVRTYQLHVNVIGFTLLAQGLHTLHVGN